MFTISQGFTSTFLNIMDDITLLPFFYKNRLFSVLNFLNVLLKFDFSPFEIIFRRETFEKQELFYVFKIKITFPFFSSISRN